MVASTPKNAAPLGVALGSRLGFFLAALLGLAMLGPARPDAFLLHGGAPHPAAAVDLFQRWDAYWFLNIAREGYQYHGVQPQVGQVPRQREETNITPFPLYPLSIWLTAHLTGDRSIAGLLVSLVCFLAAAFVLHRDWRARFGRSHATRALTLLALCPGAFIYNAPYSEALFLLLTALCLSRAARGQPLQAGLFGLGASATRLAGLLLAPAVALQLWLKPDRPPASRAALQEALLAATLVASGAGIYFLYLYRITGDPLAYFTAQQGWHKMFTAPWSTLAAQLTPDLLREPTRLLNLGSAALFISLTVAALRRWRAGEVTTGEVAYLGLGVLMPLCSSNLLGLPRYLMVLFPAYPVLARWVSTCPRFWAACALFCLVNLPLLMAWLRWSYSL